MDLTEATAAIEQAGTDFGTVAIAVIAVVALVFGFRMVKRALAG